MKPQYKKRDLWKRDRQVYENKYSYFRNPRTRAEIRFLAGADRDGEKVRRRRLTIPSAYDDVCISRNWGKSWKDYTKNRRQWGRG